jgi:rhomboid protease GluP
VPPGGDNCPFCWHYNPNDARRCGRCDQVLPPPGASRFLRDILGEELWATKVLFVINVFVFACEMADAGKQAFGLSLVGVPMSTLVRFGAIAGPVGANEPYRVLSACFVHMGIIHVGMNMMSLIDLGRTGESSVGGARFTIAYVVTGIVGFFVSNLWYGADGAITAGASGAVFGLLGMLLGGMAVRRDPRWKDMLVRTLLFSVVFYYMLRTNQAAHMGGLVTGIALGVLFAVESRPWRRAIVMNLLAAVMLVGCIVSLVLPHRARVWREIRAYEVARKEGRTSAPIILPDD